MTDENPGFQPGVDLPMLRFRLHLNTGTTLDVLIPEDERLGLDTEEYAAQLMAGFNESRPSWAILGNVTFFSGAVSAIEVEALA